MAPWSLAPSTLEEGPGDKKDLGGVQTVRWLKEGLWRYIKGHPEFMSFQASWVQLLLPMVWSQPAKRTEEYVNSPTWLLPSLWARKLCSSHSRRFNKNHVWLWRSRRTPWRRQWGKRAYTENSEWYLFSHGYVMFEESFGIYQIALHQEHNAHLTLFLLKNYVGLPQASSGLGLADTSVLLCHLM